MSEESSSDHQRQRSVLRRRWTWKRRSAVVGIVLLTAMLTAATTAWGAQGGRYKILTGHSLLKETVAVRTASSSGTGDCLITAALVANSSAQLETGLLNCHNGGPIDNSCTDGHVFIETHTSSTGYQCYMHGTFSASSYYQVGAQSVGHGSGSSTYLSMNGLVAGSYYEGINTLLNANGVYIRTWAEHIVGGDSCSGWHNSSLFTNWQYEDNSLTTRTLGTDTSVATSCFTVGGISGGAYNVSH